MFDYFVDDNIDIVLPLVKITDPDALLFQQVILLLNTWTSDFVYDINAGIDYEGKMLGIDVDVTDIEIEYYNKISVLPFFKSLDNFSIEQTVDRNIIVSFDVTSQNDITQTFTQET